MNALQKYNNALLRKYIFSSRILTSLTIPPDGIIRLDILEWQDYWGDTPLQPLLDNLFLSWHQWITSRFDRTELNRYVYDYFRLLEEGLSAYHAGEIDRCFLNKIVAFETFWVYAMDEKNHVAALFSERNPNYLLHKIPNPIAFDDPKYLPVICRREQWDKAARLHFHYRRIPRKYSRGTQLFVYPPVASIEHEGSGFGVIDLLFRTLTRNNDPWVKFRCDSLAKSVFNDLALSLNKPKISLLDLGCGSAKIAMRLCVQAYTDTQCSFDVSLVDTIPPRFSIAHSFYHNSQAFEAIRYRRNNLFSWVSNMQNETAAYDITLMLRVWDTMCQLEINSLPVEQILASVKPLDVATLRTPTSRLIQDFPGRIVQSLHKIRTQHGAAYFQPSLRDFFKAVSICCGNNGDNAQVHNELFLPVRSFSENHLVMKDGTSIIGRIMEKSQHLIIEDSDISLELLCHHANKRQLGRLAFANKRPLRSPASSHYILVSHSNR